MKNRIENLLSEAEQQKEIYKATTFWETAIEPILRDISKHGVENFRQWNSALTYFVPTYGFPGNSLPQDTYLKIKELVSEAATSKQKNTITNFVDGRNQALSDFRVAKAILQKNAPEIFLNYSESSVGNPIEQFTFEGRKYSRSSLNYLLGLAALSQYEDLTNINKVLEIGGGFGSLGEILFTSNDDLKYCNLDIPPTCVAAEYFLDQVVQKKCVRNFDSKASKVDFNQDDWSVSVLPNWNIENICGDIDLFVNYISFQEMEPNVVENYLDHVARLNPKWILIRHIREGKEKKTSTNPIGVNNPVMPEDYERYLTGYQTVLQDCTLFGYETPDFFHSDVLILKRLA